MANGNLFVRLTLNSHPIDASCSKASRIALDAGEERHHRLTSNLTAIFWIACSGLHLNRDTAAVAGSSRSMDGRRESSEANHWVLPPLWGGGGGKLVHSYRRFEYASSGPL